MWSNSPIEFELERESGWSPWTHRIHSGRLLASHRNLQSISTSRSAETPARSPFQAGNSFQAFRIHERCITSSHSVSVSQAQYRDAHPLAVDHAPKSSGSYQENQNLY